LGAALNFQARQRVRGEGFPLMRRLWGRLARLSLG
jgi:hypothetical protein